MRTWSFLQLCLTVKGEPCIHALHPSSERISSPKASLAVLLPALTISPSTVTFALPAVFPPDILSETSHPIDGGCSPTPPCDPRLRDHQAPLMRQPSTQALRSGSGGTPYGNLLLLHLAIVCACLSFIRCQIPEGKPGLRATFPSHPKQSWCSRFA